MVGGSGTGNPSKNWNADDRHRQQAMKNGVFSNIWPDAPVYLQDRLATTLRGMFMLLLLDCVCTHTCNLVCINQKIQANMRYTVRRAPGVFTGGVSVGKKFPPELASPNFDRKSWCGGDT